VSLFRTERIGVGIDARSIVCLRGDEGRSVSAFDAPVGASALGAQASDAAIHDALGALGAHRSRRGRHVDVVVSSELARHWIVDLPGGISSLKELQALASARFSQTFGVSAQDWHLTGDWRNSGTVMCAALPRWIVAAVDAGCTAAGLPYRVDSCLGAMLRTERPRLPADGWICVQTPRSHALLKTRAGVPSRIRALPRSTRANRREMLEDAAIEISREALRSGAPVNAKVTWIEVGARDSEPQGSAPARVNDMEFEFLGAPWPESYQQHGEADEADVAALLGAGRLRSAR
jgi:hypothetical protein